MNTVLVSLHCAVYVVHHFDVEALRAVFIPLLPHLLPHRPMMHYFIKLTSTSASTYRVSVILGPIATPHCAEPWKGTTLPPVAQMFWSVVSLWWKYYQRLCWALWVTRSEHTWTWTARPSLTWLLYFLKSTLCPALAVTVGAGVTNREGQSLDANCHSCNSKTCTGICDLFLYQLTSSVHITEVPVGIYYICYMHCWTQNML